jgi:hypothetical protein
MRRVNCPRRLIRFNRAYFIFRQFVSIMSALAAFTTAFRITFVALDARGRAEGLCMAGPAATAAMVHTTAALVGDTGMRPPINR